MLNTNGTLASTCAHCRHERVSQCVMARLPVEVGAELLDMVRERLPRAGLRRLDRDVAPSELLHHLIAGGEKALVQGIRLPRGEARDGPRGLGEDCLGVSEGVIVLGYLRPKSASGRTEWNEQSLMRGRQRSLRGMPLTRFPSSAAGISKSGQSRSAAPRASRSSADVQEARGGVKRSRVFLDHTKQSSSL